MNEKLTICPKCGGDACHEASNEKLTVWSCFGCGFTSNSTIIEIIYKK
jgi:ribosomal protein L37AE/L43A